MKKTDKKEITVNVRKDRYRGSYRISGLKTPNRYCYLCPSMYEKIIGAEVVGKVKFILRKIKGKASNYVFPFRFDGGALESYYIEEGELSYAWNYLKYDELLGEAINIRLLKRWAGKSMFSIEMEYEVEI